MRYATLSATIWLMPRTPISELTPHTTTRRPFSRFAKFASAAMGHPVTFAVACMVVVTWAFLGETFGYSDQWQLFINTGTTIATFLMVFLIQNSQNRDAQAMQIKLDELIRADKIAHNALLDLEELTEKELNTIKKQYAELADQARAALRKGKKDTGIKELHDLQVG